MHISLLLMNQIIQLFIMIFMGFIIVKANLLKAEDSKILSVIVLYLIIPCVIINHTCICQRIRCKPVKYSKML